MVVMKAVRALLRNVTDGVVGEILRRSRESWCVVESVTRKQQLTVFTETERATIRLLLVCDPPSFEPGLGNR